MRSWALRLLAVLCLLGIWLPSGAMAANSRSGTAENSAAVSDFEDVKPGDYCYDAVQWAVQDGITLGTTSTTFSPSNTCTRNQILTFIWRMEGSRRYSGVSSPFVDQDAQGDFGQAALWAYRNGLELGSKTEKGSLLLNGSVACTRRETVVYLWRLDGCPDLGTENVNRFTDVTVDRTDISKELARAVHWAVEIKITNGYSETTFEPDRPCTRGQIVTFLYRYAMYLKDKSVS